MIIGQASPVEELEALSGKKTRSALELHSRGMSNLINGPLLDQRFRIAA